jgi:YesN/AraC family two-component response regulator
MRAGEQQVKVLIVDDERDMRSLLRMLIDEANHGLRVVAEAEDGEGALVQWRQEKPTVIVLDNRMPGMSGLEIAEEILREQPDQPIVLFTAYADRVTVQTAADLGVRCLSKTDLSRVTESIWAAAAP